MTNRTMIDSAYPLHPEPVRDITLAYIGGDTPHSWSQAEILAMPSRWALPTWVRSDPQDVSPAGDAVACIERLKALGVPAGTTVCLDLEMAVAAAYVSSFNAALLRAGSWLTMKYGSRSYIWRNPKTSGGTFVADPTGVPHMDAEGDCVATQYAFLGSRDLSEVKDQATVPLWEISPPGKQPHPTWETTMMRALPVLKLNAPEHNDVRRVQALLGAAGHHLRLDGVYGPLTEAAVKLVQAAHGLPADGVTGPHTWAVLVTGADL